MLSKIFGSTLLAEIHDAFEVDFSVIFLKTWLIRL